ncbi:MAG: selenium-dependent molybdenum cofactor biosynthesis protein YqeB [Clostridiaceae bacterium]
MNHNPSWWNDEQAWRVVIKGGGDLGSGVAWRLHQCGFQVVITEIDQPTVIRRTVAFATSVFTGSIGVEGLLGRCVKSDEDLLAFLARREIPVLVDPRAAIVDRWQPGVVVDAILAKKNLGTSITDAPVVVALGPGFTAGMDCHAVIETNRGHRLGRVIRQGCAEADTGVPGTIGGESKRRILTAPMEGIFHATAAIGDLVHAGQVVGQVEGQPVVVTVDGVLRGILQDGLNVSPGLKLGDVDPRCKQEHCYLISDKALAIAGGVLEAIFSLQMEHKQRGKLG